MRSIAALLVLLAWTPGPQAQAPGHRNSADLLASAPAPVLNVQERAELYLARKQYTDAIGLLRETIRSGDRRPALYNLMGIAAEQLQRYHEAEGAYRNAIRGDQKKAAYDNNLGTVYYAQHNWGKALKWYRKAIHHPVTISSFYVNAGMAEFARHHYRDANTYFRKALLIDPNALFAASNAGTVVQDIDQNNPGRFHFDLSRLFCSMGDVKDCARQIQMAIELKYSGVKDVYKDPAFAPLRKRPDFAAIMSAPR